MATKLQVPMVIPFSCPTRASATVMAAAITPAATIGRPRPMVRTTRGTSTSVRAICTWTTINFATGLLSGWSKIKDCARKSAIEGHSNHSYGCSGEARQPNFKSCEAAHDILKNRYFECIHSKVFCAACPTWRTTA